MLNYYLEEGFPFSSGKLKKLKCFLNTCGLDYDQQISYSVTACGLDGKILAAGSRCQNVLKCLAVSETCQGQGFLNIIMAKLLANAHTQGYSHLFLFTKPAYSAIFKDLGFYSIINTGKIEFMENISGGIHDYLNEERAKCPPLSQDVCTGAIVMNANPFTLGHLHLVKQAQKSCDRLHIFVLSEDTPPFPAADRLALVRENCRGLPHVYVHGGSEYLISHATFPDYFMKDKHAALTANGELDLLLFAAYFKEAFHISKRFVGEEPFCPVTQGYNMQMEKILPAHGIQVCVLPRYAVQGVPVSATQVRQYYLQGNLAAIAPLVPEPTFTYLKRRINL